MVWMLGRNVGEQFDEEALKFGIRARLMFELFQTHPSGKLVQQNTKLVRWYFKQTRLNRTQQIDLIKTPVKLFRVYWFKIR